MFLETVFWISAAGAAYSYFLYPGLLWGLLSFERPAKAERTSVVECVSIIIAARNEQGKIASKIENTLALECSGVRSEILVASDASDDATDAIAQSYADRGVRLIRSPTRCGKEHAQALAIRESLGDVIVFSDAGTVLPPTALRNLLLAFTDVEVGAVSSVDKFLTEDGRVEGEGMYVRYEMWLRGLESRLAGLVGLSGSFFAARRQMCADWNTSLPSDFNTALNCARAGMRAVSDPKVVGMYRNLADPAGEYKRKVRTVVRGMSAIASKPDVLNPLRFGMFAWQVWSHKIMRWAVPIFLILLLVVSVALARKHHFYAMALGMQLGFYALAFITHTSKSLQRRSLPRLVYFFTLVNVGILEALLRLCLGQRMTTWQPSRR